MKEAIQEAAEALRRGCPVVFPTDTVYGIGVAVRYAATPAALFEAKRREPGKPIAWLVAGPQALDEYGAHVPARARELAAAHWPGALTIIVKASPAVPAAYQSPAGSIGLRMPASEAALALVREVGPIATTSANLSGAPAPRTFAELDPLLLGAAAACIAAEGELASGVASTVVDCSSGELLVLRAGDVAV